MNVIQLLAKRVGKGRYVHLRAGLKSARMYKSPEEYLSTAITSSIVIGFFLGAMVFFFSWYFLRVSIVYAAPLSALLASVCSCVFYAFSMAYPSMVAKDRGRKIDAKLPHAAALFYALSKGGSSPIEMFRVLGEREDEYGEISKEAVEVVRGVEYFGYNPPGAILEVSESTPSDEFREFLRSFTTVIETGAGVEEFLAKRCEDYYSRAETSGRRALDQIALYSELYVIALGLGPFLAIVVWIPMGTMGGGMFQPLVIQLLTYLGIPLGSIGFLLLLDRFSTPAVKKKHFEKGGEAPAKKLGISLKIGGMKKAPSSLLRSFFEDPSNVFLMSVPLAAIFAMYRLYSGFLDETTIFISLLISVLPFIFFYELRKRMVEKVIGATPSFLESLSAAVTSGLPPAEAIKTLPPERFGPLTLELKTVRRDVEWGDSISEALSKLERRIRSGLLTRVVSVMERASKATARISDVLRILAKDVSTEIALRQERIAATFIYVVIIYMIFGVTLMTGVGMTILSPMMGIRTEVGGMATGGLQAETVQTLFFHLILVQSFCMGLIAGKFRTGSVLDGLKHSMLLCFIGWLTFTLGLGFIRGIARGLMA